jgi:hypothetical protein
MENRSTRRRRRDAEQGRAIRSLSAATRHRLEFLIRPAVSDALRSRSGTWGTIRRARARRPTPKPNNYAETSAPRAREFIRSFVAESSATASRAPRRAFVAPRPRPKEIEGPFRTRKRLPAVVRHSSPPPLPPPHMRKGRMLFANSTQPSRSRPRRPSRRRTRTRQSKSPRLCEIYSGPRLLGEGIDCRRPEHEADGLQMQPPFRNRAEYSEPRCPRNFSCSCNLTTISSPRGRDNLPNSSRRQTPPQHHYRKGSFEGRSARSLRKGDKGTLRITPPGVTSIEKRVHFQE